MLKKIAIKINWIVSSQFGFDLRVLLRSLLGLPAYIKDLHTFRKKYKGSLSLMPCLHDRYEEGGTTKNEYFWQDLLVARWIFEAKPLRHVDVGSRVDGFVAHVASFREIEVFDVRPISTLIPGIVFRKADLMEAKNSLLSGGNGYCDSLSCLHALEHFGLGRYGDPVDPLGYEHGIVNMTALLQPGGIFYLSTPIGRERVEFNANRVFDPQKLVSKFEDLNFELLKMNTIQRGGVVEAIEPKKSLQMKDIGSEEYRLGIFVFRKKNLLP